MKFYSVSYSYNYATLTVGVEAESEEQACDQALVVLEGEWGKNVYNYSDVNVETLS